MNGSIQPCRRRVERGIYKQSQDRYAVYVIVAANPRFRTIAAETVTEGRRERALLRTLDEFSASAPRPAPYVSGPGTSNVSAPRYDGESSCGRLVEGP